MGGFEVITVMRVTGEFFRRTPCPFHQNAKAVILRFMPQD
jgi:hypothetical protein